MPKRKAGRPTNHERAIRTLVAATVAKLQAEIDRMLAERLADFGRRFG